MPFSIQYYCPIVQTVQNSQFYLYALSLFAGSGTIIPDPDPGKSSGSTRIRIHNTGDNLLKLFLTHTHGCACASSVSWRVHISLLTIGTGRGLVVCTIIPYYNYLTLMVPHVLLEWVSVHISLLTVGTGEGLVVRVDLRMTHQTPLVNKGFAAVVTPGHWLIDWVDGD